MAWRAAEVDGGVDPEIEATSPRGSDVWQESPAQSARKIGKMMTGRNDLRGFSETVSFNHDLLIRDIVRLSVMFRKDGMATRPEFFWLSDPRPTLSSALGREADGLVAEPRSANAKTGSSVQALFSQSSIDARRMIEADRPGFRELTAEASAALQNANQLEHAAEASAQAPAAQPGGWVEREAAEILANAQRDGEASHVQARAGYASAEAFARTMQVQASVDASKQTVNPNGFAKSRGFLPASQWT